MDSLRDVLKPAAELGSDVSIVEANLRRRPHGEAVVDLLDAFARERTGIGRPLSNEVRRRLIPALRAQPNVVALLAFLGPTPVGIAIAIQSFSTFSAAPVLNIHDLFVGRRFRGRKLGRELIRHLEDKARTMGCVRITLEVREDNGYALRLYESCGFEGRRARADRPRTLFCEKTLNAPIARGSANPPGTAPRAPETKSPDRSDPPRRPPPNAGERPAPNPPRRARPDPSGPPPANAPRRPPPNRDGPPPANAPRRPPPNRAGQPPATGPRRPLPNRNGQPPATGPRRPLPRRDGRPPAPIPGRPLDPGSGAPSANPARQPPPRASGPTPERDGGARRRETPGRPDEPRRTRGENTEKPSRETPDSSPRKPRS